jgi:hypothetical protein
MFSPGTCKVKDSAAEYSGVCNMKATPLRRCRRRRSSSPSLLRRRLEFIRAAVVLAMAFNVTVACVVILVGADVVIVASLTEGSLSLDVRAVRALEFHAIDELLRACAVYVIAFTPAKFHCVNSGSSLFKRLLFQKSRSS